MDIASLAYLSRYLFILILLFGTHKLVRFSLAQIRARFRLKETALPGYFLLMKPRKDLLVEQLPHQVKLRQGTTQSLWSFPLYPTTILGRSSACDLRFDDKSLLRRCVQIYRFDQAWFIRPIGKCSLSINGEQIRESVTLESRDLIAFADYQLTFIDERVETERLGRTYDEKLADVQSGHYAALAASAASGDELLTMADVLSRKGSFTPWLMLNLFMILSLTFMYLLFPSTDQDDLLRVGIYPIIVAVLLNAYYLLLPFTTKNFDRTTYLTFAKLIVFGNLIQFRLSLVNRSQIIMAQLNGETDKYRDLLDYVISDYLTQETALLLGLLLLPFVYLFTSRTRLLENMIGFCLVLTPALYIITLILGRDPGGTHGARLWLRLGGFSLQLTEFAKISYLIVLAGFFKIRPKLKIQLAFALWAGFNFFLIMLLPDLGSVMILLPTTLIVYVIMTAEYLRAGALLVMGSGISAFAYYTFPYVKHRIYGWQSLWTEINPRNEQIVFGLQAVARGGLFGRGLGNGSPAGIPEVFGDMVYTILCEEWGILVGLMLVVWFLNLWLRSVYVATESEDGFAASMSLGIATLLFTEAMVVIGGCTGLIPLTGATLPFIAKGGSSLLAKFILMGLLLGFSGRSSRRAYEE